MMTAITAFPSQVEEALWIPRSMRVFFLRDQGIAGLAIAKRL
jgi:hypothetical protein